MAPIDMAASTSPTWPCDGDGCAAARWGGTGARWEVEGARGGRWKGRAVVGGGARGTLRRGVEHAIRSVFARTSRWLRYRREVGRRRRRVRLERGLYKSHRQHDDACERGVEQGWSR
eukprot:4907259-Prymnesium_polylepis.1